MRFRDLKPGDLFRYIGKPGIYLGEATRKGAVSGAFWSTRPGAPVGIWLIRGDDEWTADQWPNMNVTIERWRDE